MIERKWSLDASVVVCGVENGAVTPNGKGVQKFVDLATARQAFPDLDPEANTKRFTRAMGDPAKNEMRFETYAAQDLYSS